MASVAKLRKKTQGLNRPWATTALATKDSSLSFGLETLYHLLGNNNNQKGSLKRVLYSSQSTFINYVISIGPYYHSVKK